MWTQCSGDTHSVAGGFHTGSASSKRVGLISASVVTWVSKFSLLLLRLRVGQEQSAGALSCCAQQDGGEQSSEALAVLVPVTLSSVLPFVLPAPGPTLNLG